jgi:hypothetical protein
VWQGPIEAGDTLYAVGFPPNVEAPEMQTIALRVADVTWTDGHAIHPRLIGVRAGARGGDDLRGWSGAFVGRYDATRDQWRYVGLLMGLVPDAQGTTAAFVLRPPAGAWDSLTQ